MVRYAGKNKSAPDSFESRDAGRTALPRSLLNSILKCQNHSSNSSAGQPGDTEELIISNNSPPWRFLAQLQLSPR